MGESKNNRPRNMGNCEMCYYWEKRDKNTSYGTCHRFPGGGDTKEHYYCGEFVLKNISPFSKAASSDE